MTQVLQGGKLDELLASATTIEKDGLGIKVAALSDGRFLKLFRRKRGLSSDLWSSSAKRFADNARELITRNVKAPEISEVFSVPDRRLSAVMYQPLPGETLRQHFRQLNDLSLSDAIADFGAFLGDLHQRGIYFRSLHLGNVIYLPDQTYGLIDLSDMYLAKRALSAWKRRRNLHHILRYKEDIDWLARTHREAWIRGYARTAEKKYAEQFAQDIKAFKLPL